MMDKEFDILLADDDKDDCLFFKEALEELPIKAHLATVYNGDQVMARLTKVGSKLPDVLFLDLNMPRKNGFACLARIKQTKELEDLPVIIFSTSYQERLVDQVYKDAAHYYIRKPADFSDLKKVIYEALMLLSEDFASIPEKNNFVLNPYLKND